MGPPGLLIATELGSPGDGLAAAAATAVAMAARDEGEPGTGSLLVEVGARGQRRPTLLSSSVARGLEQRVAEADLPWRPAARGRICWAGVAMEDGWPEVLGSLVEVAGCPVVAHLPAPAWREALDEPFLAPGSALVRADVAPNRDLLALLARELRARGVRLRVAARGLGLVGARRALAGLDPGGPGGRRSARLARGSPPRAARRSR